MPVYGTSFIYDGISSDRYQLLLAGIGDETDDEVDMGLNVEPLVSESPLPFKLDYGIQYSNPLSFRITVTHKDGSYFSYFQIREIAAWLTGRPHPCWLQILHPEYDDVYYCCRATEIYKRKQYGKVIGLSILFTCNSSFGFSDEIIKSFQIDKPDYTFILYNDSDEETPIRPLITARMDPAYPTLKIENLTTNDTFQLDHILSGDTITINNQNQFILINDRYKNLGSDFNLGWIHLKRGINEIRVNGNSTLEFRYRYLLKGGDL